MKYLQLVFAILFLLFAFGFDNKKEKSKILFNPQGPAVLNNLEGSGDSKVELLSDRNAIRLNFGGIDKAPVIVIFDRSRTWKLSEFNFLAADITNPGTEEILVEMRLNAEGWASQGKVIPPGTTRTIRMIIPQDSLPEYFSKKMIGMYNLPNEIIRTDKKADSIDKISFLVVCPTKGSAIRISNIRGEGDLRFPTKEQMEGDYFPLVDEFGQYRHADWPEKIHNMDELKKSILAEQEDIKNHPKPSEWDKYGGWLTGPQLKPTGHFRTEKVDGKWWLVDPDGHLFWSKGIGSISVGDGQVPITDREFYFANLPDRIEYKEFYETGGWSAPFGYYQGRQPVSFNQTGWNLYKKYGENWKDIAGSLALKRLTSWRDNTIAAWSSPDIFLKDQIPYTPIVMINSKKIEGSKGHWCKFPDPYDRSFVESLTSGINDLERAKTDPYCIGYFVDNEITWGGSSSTANWAIASPANQPAKIALLDFLRKKHVDVGHLNSQWHTRFTSWDEFLVNTKALNLDNEDTREFTLMTVKEYFKKVTSTLRNLAPDKLYLGPRLDFHFYPSEIGLNDWDFRNNWIVNIAAQYCDVVSFNRYRNTAADLRPGDFDKPVIVGEWHHTPLGKGSFYTSADNFVENLQMRAEKYEYFLKSCINNPYVVGAHYFQFFDQPTVGRSDGENFACGFMSICDLPHSDMVNAAREIGNELYSMRSAKKSVP
jgi:hypothetical protein